jgi:hypothetical protein
MEKQNHHCYRYPELEEVNTRFRQRLQSMSDQEVINCYNREMLKLKVLNQFGRYSAQFRGYPNTRVINLCSRIADARNLPRPSLILSAEGQEQPDRSQS